MIVLSAGPLLAGVGGAAPVPRGVLLVAGLAVAWGSWALAARGTVPDWERSVFRWANGLPAAAGVVLVPVMQLGSLAGGVVAGVVLGLLAGSPTAAAVLAGAVVGAWLLAKVVKRRVRRGRPADFFDDAVLRERASDFGYVSGHTMLAVTLAVACGPVVPAWGELALLAAGAAVGTGRLYVGAHLPLDVAGGAGLGIAVGAAGAVLLDALV